MSQRESQESLILKHLQAGNKITPLDALNMFGCFRLGGRIYGLKKLGHRIEKRMIETPSGKHVAQYFIPKPETLFEL